MKLTNTFLSLLLVLTLFSCGSEEKETEDTSTDTTAAEVVEETPSKVIKEPFSDKEMLKGIFNKEFSPDYTHRYNQIGDNFILGGYTYKDTLNFGTKMNVNIDLHTCEKKPCKEISQAARDKEMESILYFFKDGQQESEHFTYTSEEIEVDGKKMSLFYKYHWFAPKEPKDTVSNKKHEVILYYNNGTNGLRITSFPYSVKNIAAEDWKAMADKATLKKHAEAVAKEYLQYY